MFVQRWSTARGTSRMHARFRWTSWSNGLTNYRATVKSWRTAAGRTACFRTKLLSFCKRTDSACAALRKAFRSGVPRGYRSLQRKGEHSMVQTIEAPAIDLDSLREAIQDEYALVADEPQHGFHFLVGRPLAQLLGYAEDWLDGIPEPTI